MKNDIYWLWLQKSLGYGARLCDLISYYGSAKDMYLAGERDWLATSYFDGSPMHFKYNKLEALSNTPLQQFEATIDLCRKHSVTIITPDDDEYPKRLRDISDFPAVLFARGDISVLSHKLMIGVIGSRHPSNYGIRAVNKIAGELAKSSVVIVSGGALGIDSAAHRLALENGSKTVMVIGCGHDVDYPKENADLRQMTEQNGVIVSEYKPLTKPESYYFPKRNRIISGLSRAVLIVEASVVSGSLNTAHHAMIQGRDVFAVPGDISSEAYSGSNKLISSGARAAFSAEDILKRYAITVSKVLKPDADVKTPFDSVEIFENGKPSKKKMVKKAKKESQVKNDEEKSSQKNEKISNFDPESVSNNAQIVYNIMSNGQTMLDDIVYLSKLPVNKVLTALTELELMGAVEAESGGRYSII